MKNLITLCCLVLSGFSVQLMAVTVEFPQHLVVTSINGKADFNRGMISLREAGVNVVAFQYQDYFSFNGDDSGQWVNSAPMYLLLELTGNKHYLISQLRDIDSADDAQAFIENPQIYIQEQGKQKYLVKLITGDKLSDKLLRGFNDLPVVSNQ